MSKLASNLPVPSDVISARVRKGPRGACDIYGNSDLDDWAAVDVLRDPPNSWATAQREVDKTLGIELPLDEGQFRYHWRGKCWHWTPVQKAWIRDQYTARESQS